MLSAVFLKEGSMKSVVVRTNAEGTFFWAGGSSWTKNKAEAVMVDSSHVGSFLCTARCQDVSPGEGAKYDCESV